MGNRIAAARGFLRNLAPLSLILAAQTTLAQSGLDRGHSILLERGLQIQAQAFPRVEDSGRIVGFSLSRWAQSNFTTVNWHSNYDAAQYLGAAPGIPWGRYGVAWNDPYLKSSESPYASNFVSYQYKDEQDLGNSTELDTARIAIDLIHKRYPDTLAYTNQWGSQLSTSTMQNYMSVARPDMLMFDTYPFSGFAFGAARSPKTFYEHLQKYRQLGLAGNDGTGASPIPYGLYTQTFVVGGHSVSDSEMRLNQFSAWAMGYTFASAFTYTAAHEMDHDLDPILFSGLGDSTPTTRFFRMADINAQSRKLGPSLVRLKSTDIRMIPGQYKVGTSGTSTNPLPSGISAWNGTSDPYITGITPTNIGTQNDGRRGDVLIGYFKPLHESYDGPNYTNETYFMLVNGLIDPTLDADARQNIRLTFNFGTTAINSLQRIDRTTGQIVTVPLVSDGGPIYHLDWVLDGGLGDLFKFNTGAMFVPGPGWAKNGSGDWNHASNWLSGIVPNGIGAQADFTGIINANRTVYTDAAITVGTLQFENVNTYVLTGSGTLTMQNSGASSAGISVKLGAQKIALPLVIASSTTINVAGGASLRISNPVTVNSGKQLTQTGSGTVIYESTLTLQPSASAVIAGSASIAKLDLTADSTLSVKRDDLLVPSTLQVGQLTLQPGAVLELENNQARLQLTEAETRDLIRSESIRSSLRDAQTSLGFVPLESTEVKIALTLRGDANLDERVDSVDFVGLASHFGTAGFWSNGDFDYSGRIDTNDFNLLAGNFGVELTSGASTTGTVVPEPCLLMTLTPVVVLFARHRREDRSLPHRI